MQNEYDFSNAERGKFFDPKATHQLPACLEPEALDDRYSLNPERFTKDKPIVAMPKEKVLINPITPEELAEGVSNVVNFPTLNRVKEKYTLT